MSESSAFLILEQSCDEAIKWIAGRIREAGLEVLQTFDLQVARQAHSDCPCLHHGTEPCDCQMVVMLVYGKGRQPVSIAAHGYNRRTWFSVVDTPQQRADPLLKAAIRRAMMPEILPPVNNCQENLSHAA